MVRMFRFLAPVLLACSAWGQQQFELSGRFSPAMQASVSIFGVASPFVASPLSDEGRFTFKKLQPGAYTIAIFVPGRGEARRTIEVGPGNADARQRVQLTLSLKDSDFVLADALRRHSVPVKQLAVPE